MKQVIKSFTQGKGGSWLISSWLKFVSLTSRHIYDPPDPDARFGTNGPVIYATWHGQNFIFAFRFRNRKYPHLMVALHGDGRMIGQAMANLGVPLIFGSGGAAKDQKKKGGARAFLQMIKALRAGHSVTQTADVPKTAREVGDGILLMARKSGAPIIPVAMTTSRRTILKTWDQMQWNWPFSRMVFVEAPAIRIPDDDSDLQPFREQLKTALDTAQLRAFTLADR